MEESIIHARIDRRCTGSGKQAPGAQHHQGSRQGGVTERTAFHPHVLSVDMRPFYISGLLSCMAADRNDNL